MRRKSWVRPFLAAAAALALPAVAAAGDVVVPPLVAKGIDPLVVLNLTSLLSSELDFMGNWDEVNQLDSIPSGLNSTCFTSGSCLSGVARAQGAENLIGGTVVMAGDNFEFNLVYFDAAAGRILRQKTFKLPNQPSVIADSMGGYIKELVTGVSQAQEQAASSLGDFGDTSTVALLDEEDDFPDIAPPTVSRRIQTPTSGDDFDDFELEDRVDPEEERRAAEDARLAREEEDRRAAEAESRRRAEDEARRKAEAEAARRAEEDARRKAEAEAARRAEEDARRKAEADARRRAEEDERRRQEEDDRRRAAAAVDEDEIEFGRTDPNAIELEEISFASAASLIELDDESAEDELDDFDARSSSRAPTSRAPTSRSSADDDFDDRSTRSSSRSSSRDSDARDSRSSSRDSGSRDSRSSSRDTYEDFDEDRPSRSSSRDSDTRSSRGSSRDSYDYDEFDEGIRRPSKDEEEGGSSLALAARVGFSGFQKLGFLTYGAELAFHPVSSVAIVAGAEAYSVKRNIPAALQEVGGATSEWNTILPINLGALYQLGKANTHPYLGADLVMIPSYVKEAGGMAIGGRARAGVDFLLSDRMGINVNGALGLWSGKNFSLVASGVANAGLAPQISGGTVFLF